MRAVVVGLPNVGKSTLINAIAGRNRAKTGPKPGLTRSQQWVVVDKDMELLDTPGIMVPNVGDIPTGLRLALLALVKVELISDELLAEFLHEQWLQQGIEHPLVSYGIDPLPERFPGLLAAIAERFGILLNGGGFDSAQAARRLIHDFREGQFGPLSLEQPPAPPPSPADASPSEPTE